MCSIKEDNLPLPVIPWKIEVYGEYQVFSEIFAPNGIKEIKRQENKSVKCSVKFLLPMP